MPASPKTFHVKSFGCQMNVYDGERMAELMAAQGLSTTDDAAAADLIVLNTCHIRERATERVYSEIGRLRKDAGEQGRKPMIAVAGCVAQAEGAEIVRRAKVDVVVGPQAYHNLPDLVAKARRARRRSTPTCRSSPSSSTCPSSQGQPLGLPDRAGRLRQILHLLRRALYACAEVSRSYSAIMDEARSLVDAGAREITLLARTSMRGTMPTIAACTA